MELSAGTRVGPYEIQRRIGAGGMGVVYGALDGRLGRKVAIKVLPASLRDDSDRLRRFEQEARTVGGLNHPNLVTLHDVGHHEGVPYLVTELLDGQALRGLLAGGTIRPDEAVRIAGEVARGLVAAHGAGIVHRDIKPDNIFVTAEGRVKILDFGIAKILDPSLKESKQLTADGAIMGTPEYMAPEQCRGSPPDRRSDIYALGCVAFELLLGEPPFRGKIAPLFAAHLTKPPRVPSAVDPDARIPPALDAVILCCLEKLPDRRFQHGAALCVALQGVPGYRPLRVPPVS